jgi:ABC-type polysaccharide/polyol phosphate transport system ATPase subunit
MNPLQPGEVVLRDATRWFSVRADQARTLKGFFLGARAAGPPPVPALQGVSLHIAPGETLGMVGRNGAGKSSTLRVLAGIIPLQAGEAACGGRIMSLLELAAGFSRDFTGRENVYLQGALYGLPKSDLDANIDHIIGFSELGDFIDAPVKTYSSGMLLRLGFSIAVHLDADVLLIDEVLAVGDEAFQRKCLRRISERIASGATVVLVSHDASSIERVCDRVVVLDSGRIVFDGPTAEGLLHYHRLMGTEDRSGELLRRHAAHGLEVVDVELCDGAGRPSAVFRRGGSLQVIIAVQATDSVSAPVLSLEVRSEDGTRVFRTLQPLRLAQDGSAQLAFEVPDLALLGGDYDVALGVGHEASAVLANRTLRFSVPREGGAEGIVDLRGSWRTLAGTEGTR